MKIPTEHFKVTPEGARDGRKNMNVIQKTKKFWRKISVYMILNSKDPHMNVFT